MKKSKIILMIIFAIAVAAVLYFTYGVVKSRYFGEKQGGVETNNGGLQDQTENQADNMSAEKSESGSLEDDVPVSENGRPIVENTDCEDDCARFKNNPGNLKYCQEVCGDRPVVQKESETQCENLEGLEKDACWRDLAVSKLDVDICDKISDTKLQTICRNRVVEELLD